MSCGFCAPFQMAIEDEELDAISPHQSKELSDDMDGGDASSSPRRSTTASPGLESIPEGFKEKSEDSEERQAKAEGDQVALAEGERETQADEVEEEEEEIERDFDEGATALYHSLQNKDWENVIALLEEAPEETMVWITRKDPADPKKLRWRILPIHAAIVFAAPDSVVEAILKTYPAGPKKQDDQGMTPLHLAFRLSAAESVVSLIYEAYPEAKDVLDKKGRTPLILAQTCKGSNKAAFLRVLEQGPRPSAADIEARLKKISEEKELEIETVRKQAEEKQSDLRKEIEALQVALVKNKETSQVLVDHITLLETDQNVKEADMVALVKLREEKEELELKIDVLRKEEINVIKLQERDQLEEDCQLLRKDIRVLKEQLAKRTANEAVLAGQVASLAQQLSETSHNNNDSTNAFVARIDNLEEERKNMRASIHILTHKLFKVGNVVKSMGDDQDRMIEQAKHQETQIVKSIDALSAIMDQLTLQGNWISSAMEERQQLRESVERQQAELNEQQKVRDEIFSAAKEHGELLIVASSKNTTFLNTITSIKGVLAEAMAEELKELPNEESSYRNADELVDQVMEQILPKSSEDEEQEKPVNEEPTVESTGEEPADKTTEEASAEVTEDEEKEKEAAKPTLPVVKESQGIAVPSAEEMAEEKKDD